jgi:hypothetical protein
LPVETGKETGSREVNFRRRLLKRIDEIFAFVVVDADGNEGIPSFLAGGTAYPLVGADDARMESYKPMARKFALEMDWE